MSALRDTLAAIDAGRASIATIGEQSDRLIAELAAQLPPDDEAENVVSDAESLAADLLEHVDAVYFEVLARGKVGEVSSADLNTARKRRDSQRDAIRSTLAALRLLDVRRGEAEAEIASLTSQSRREAAPIAATRAEQHARAIRGAIATIARHVPGWIRYAALAIATDGPAEMPSLPAMRDALGVEQTREGLLVPSIWYAFASHDRPEPADVLSDASSNVVEFPRTGGDAA